MSDASPTEFPKRFYKCAESAAVEEGWTVELDGRGLKTPQKAPLVLPGKALADAIAEEWARQEERIHIASMHLTRLANVAIDRTPLTREGMADELARYCQTDLVCHLAASPQELRNLQEAAWSPIRIWAGKTLGVVLVPVEGIIASPQPDASLAAARTHALGLDDFRLTGPVLCLRPVWLGLVGICRGAGRDRRSGSLRADACRRKISDAALGVRR